MSDELSLERMVASVMDEAASGTVPDRMIDDVLSTTGRMRPAPRWLALLKEPPMRADTQTAVGIPTRRLLLVMTIILLAIALAAVVVGASLLLKPPETTSADWPMFRGDAARTGVAVQGPGGRPVLRWRYQAPGAVSGNISIVGDLVFAPSDDGTLHALGLADGTERWAFHPGGGSVSGPAAAEGRIYVSDGAGAYLRPRSDDRAAALEDVRRRTHRHRAPRPRTAWSISARQMGYSSPSMTGRAPSAGAPPCRRPAAR